MGIPPESGASGTAAASAPRRRLGAVSALRLAAAAWMVCYHLSVTQLLDGLGLPSALRNVLGGGSALTGMFIMLSGFMMQYAYTDGAGRLKVGAREVWIGRLTRLWPTMLVAHLLALPFVFAGHDVYAPLEALGRAVAVILALQAWIPQWAFSYNGPAWTISVLVLCYALFPALAEFVRRRSRAELAALVFGCWVAMLAPTGAHFAGLATGFTPLSDRPDSVAEAVLHAFPPLRLPDFVAGMALARLFVVRGAPASRLVAGAGAISFVAVVAILALPRVLPERFVANGLLSPLFWFLLLGAAAAPRSVERALERLGVTALGDASLSMFLLHMPLMLALSAAHRLHLLPSALIAFSVIAFVPSMVLLSVLLERRFVTPVASRMREALRATPMVPTAAARALEDELGRAGLQRRTPPLRSDVTGTRASSSA